MIAADVAVNSYAFLALDFSAAPASLMMQWAFLGFVVGTLPFLWPERKAKRKKARR